MRRKAPLRRVVGLTAFVLIALASSRSTLRSQQLGSDAAARDALESADRLASVQDKTSLEQAVGAYQRWPEIAGQGRADVMSARARLGLGRALSRLSRSDEAARPLQDAVAQFRKLNDRTWLGEALIEQAFVLSRLGEGQSAMAAVSEALELSRSLADRRLEARAAVAFAYVGSAPDVSLKSALERAVETERESRDASRLAEALTAFGYFIASNQKPSDAVPAYEEALSVARAAGNARDTGRALSLLGYAAYRQGEFQKALGYFTESLAPTRRSGDRLQESYTLSNMGLSQLYSGHAAMALSTLRDVLALRRELNLRSTEGFSLHNIGLALGDLGRVAEATAAFDQALEVHRANLDTSEESITLTALAGLRRKEGDYLTSLQLYQRALQLARTANDPLRQNAAYIGIGESHAALGHYREAVDAYLASLNLAVSLENSAQQSNAERLLGQLYGLIGNRAEALAYFNRTITQSRDPLQRASALSQSAVIKAEMGEVPEARRMFQQAQELARGTPNLSMLARLADTSATLAMLAGDHRQAVRLFEEALSLRQRWSDRSAQASVLARLGQAHLANGDRRRALDYFEKALTTSYEVRNPAAESVALTSLMRYWRQQRQPAVAVFFGKQAVSLFQQTRANLVQLDAAIQRVYVESRAQIYRELADLLIVSGRLPEAQEVLDLLKQEEYLDFIRRDGQQAAIRTLALTPEERALAARYREIQDQVIDIGRRYGLLVNNRLRTAEQDREMVALESDLNAANEAFTKMLDRLDAELGRPGRRDARVIDVGNAQSLMPTLRELGPGTVAVYTLVTATRCHLMFITADARKAREVKITAAELSRLVARFREAVQTPAVDPRPIGQQLYQLLVAPIAADLDQARATTVLWVLDGVLRYLPMVALHDGRAYLAERYRSVVITPASRNSLKDTPSGSWTGIGAGVSRATAGFAALPAVSEELRGIFRQPSSASGTGVLTGRILLDDAFTADAFRAALRERAPVVHVASHFQFQPGDDVDSFLLLGDGSRLTVADLRRAANIFEGVDLLTMSACNTAIGSANARGEELESFGAWAQLNGAKAVVASLWAVADTSTREFMEHFYRASVQSSANKAEALRMAQLSLLRGSQPAGAASSPASARGLTAQSQGQALPEFVKSEAAPWAHPYYWAPFVLIGNFR